MASGFPVKFLVETALSLATSKFRDTGRYRELLAEAIERWNEPLQDKKCLCCGPAKSVNLLGFSSRRENTAL